MYHILRAHIAAFIYDYPGRKMLIVGVTGTKGKTSTANYLWSVCMHGGHMTGLLSTANFRIGNEEEINSYHMTMQGPFFTQRKLKQMHRAGVKIAIVEMTSEGMKQYRHVGIPVDIAIFTNLTPEHLDSHGGDFNKYKRAKAPLFRAFGKKKKTFNGKEIPHTILANADSEHSPYYLSFPAEQKITYGIEKGNIRATNIKETLSVVAFSIENALLELSIPGTFNIYNALPAFITGHILGITPSDIASGLKELSVIPGRMEKIDEGQPYTVLVDYAHEPASLEALLTTGRNLVGAGKKVILLSGGQGGGRDPRKREPMARLAKEKADYLIVTNEDPYFDDPVQIVEELAGYAEKAGMKRGENLFVLMDRKEGIRKALGLADSGDIVLIAGKGAELTMMTKDGPIPWNERAIVRNLIRESLS